jgi:hypothetical protein
MANAALKQQGSALRAKKKPGTEFMLKIKRNVYIIVDPGKGLTLGDEAVATRPVYLPIRGRVEAASPHSVVMSLRGGKKRRLSRSAWRVGPVVATQVIRDI